MRGSDFPAQTPGAHGTATTCSVTETTFESGAVATPGAGGIGSALGFSNGSERGG